MKTIAEITTALEKIFTSSINMQLYLGTGTRDNRSYTLADLDQKASVSIAQTYINEVRAFFSRDDMSTMPLSEIDNRANTLLCYDLVSEPAEFSTIKSIVDKVKADLFSAKSFDASDIRTLVIKISSAKSSVVFYKTFYPVSLIKRDQILLVMKSDKRLTLLDDDIIKVTPGFEVMLLDGEFYLSDFAKFEKAFAFEDIAIQSMTATVTKILGMDLVSDTAGHLAAFSASKKDILRAEKSPVFNLATGTILKFVKARQKLIGLKIKDDKIDLSTKVSVRHLFKLLNDDYLRSELTALDYETLAKNRLDKQKGTSMKGATSSV